MKKVREREFKRKFLKQQQRSDNDQGPSFNLNQTRKNDSEWEIGFNKPWGISDVALRCGKTDPLLYVNKMMLSTFAPVLKTLFFSDFAESKQEVVELDIRYVFMRDIIDILHYSREPEIPYCGNLTGLYMAAEKYDIPLVRNYVKEQLFEMKPGDALKITIDLEFEKEKEHLLKKMSKEDVAAFLKENKDTLLTAAEVAEMLTKFDGSLVVSEEASQVASENDLIPENFDHQWGTSNVILRAEDGGDLVLHANKSVLATFSPFFQNLFFSEGADELQNVVDLDVEYEVLLEILRILHHVNRKFVKKNQKIFDTSLLVKLYRAAEEYEIGVLKAFCKNQLFLGPRVDAFLASCELGLEKERKEIFSIMTVEEMDSICSKLTDSDEKLFTAKEMGEAMRKLREQTMRGTKPKSRLFGLGSAT